MNLSFNLEDASQVVIAAFALAVPVSFSEEAWKLGVTLPLTNLLLVKGYRAIGQTGLMVTE